MTANLKSHIAIWVSVIMVTGMTFVAELSGEYEIIFPEIAALTIGAWFAEKQPWKVSRKKIMILMSLSAFFGYILSAFISIPIFLKVLIAFVFCAVSLIVTRCTMLPMISACILPVLIGTKSLCYPVSVVVMTAIIISVQWIFEKYNIRAPKKHKPLTYDKKVESLRWIFLFVTISIVAAVAISFNILFIMAPPIIVTFCEFSYTDSKARKSPAIIFVIIAFCACLGACARLLLCHILNLPITAAVFIVIAFVLYIMKFLGKPFPPAGAIALLPFIIDDSLLLIFPFEVMAGSAVLITLSMLFGKYIEKGRK